MKWFSFYILGSHGQVNVWLSFCIIKDLQLVVAIVKCQRDKSRLWLFGTMAGRSRGGLSSSCEKTILRNTSHGEIIRVCIGIFSIALRNKKKNSKVLNKNTSPYFHSTLLVIWPLTMLKRTLLASYPVKLVFQDRLNCKSGHVRPWGTARWPIQFDRSTE